MMYSEPGGKQWQQLYRDCEYLIYIEEKPELICNILLYNAPYRNISTGNKQHKGTAHRCIYATLWIAKQITKKLTVPVYMQSLGNAIEN